MVEMYANVHALYFNSVNTPNRLLVVAWYKHISTCITKISAKILTLASKQIRISSAVQTR